MSHLLRVLRPFLNLSNSGSRFFSTTGFRFFSSSTVSSFSKPLVLPLSISALKKMGYYTPRRRMSSSRVRFEMRPELFPIDDHKNPYIKRMLTKIDKLFEPSLSSSFKPIVMKHMKEGDYNLVLKAMNIILTQYEAHQGFPNEQLTASFNTIIQNNLVTNLIDCSHIEASINLLARVNMCHKSIITDPCVPDIWEYLAASQAKEGWFNVALCHVLVENMPIANELISALKLLKSERCSDLNKLKTFVCNLLSIGAENLPLLISYLKQVEPRLLYSVEDLIQDAPGVFKNMFQLMNMSDGSKEVNNKIITTLKERPTLTDKIMKLCELLKTHHIAITAERFQWVLLKCEKELVQSFLVARTTSSVSGRGVHDSDVIYCLPSSRDVFFNGLFGNNISFFSMPGAKKEDSSPKPPLFVSPCS